MTKTTFKQADVVRAVKAAKAAGVKAEVVEITTPDGTRIRVSGQRAACNLNPWDEVLPSDDPTKIRP